MDFETMQSVLRTISDDRLLSGLVFASVEFAALAIAVGFVVYFKWVRAPRLVSLLWVIVLAKPMISLLVGPVFTWYALPLETPEVVVVDTQPFTSPIVRYSDQETTEKTDPIAGGVSMEGNATKGIQLPVPQKMIVALWATGVIALSIRYVVKKLMLRRVCEAAAAASEHVLECGQSAARTVGLSKIPDILVSDAVNSPALVGVFRPSVLLPKWIVSPANSHLLEWALRHEFTHCKHYDPVASVARFVAQIVFFFHPASWWVGRKWEESTELACDRALLNTNDDASTYASSLFAMCQHVNKTPRPMRLEGLFANRTQIGTRIEALLTDPLSVRRSLGTGLRIFIVAFAGLAITSGIAFSISPPEEPPVPGEPLLVGNDLLTYPWTTGFLNAYSLDDRENIRRIGTPYPLERQSYLDAFGIRVLGTPEKPPGLMAFEWNNGLPHSPRSRLYCKVPTFSQAVRSGLKLDTHQYRIAKDIQELPVPGDWVIRAETPTADLLDDFVSIIQNELRHSIRCEYKREEQKVIVARGTFQLAPDPNSTFMQRGVHLYSDEFSRETIRGGGMGDFDKMLRWVGNGLRMPVVNEVKFNSDEVIMWRDHDSGALHGLRNEERAARVEQVLENFSRQASITYSVETRMMDMWEFSRGE